MTTVPSIAEGLFTDDQPRLLGSRCRECDTVTFPSQQGCPACGAETMARAALADRGTVWTWTTQDYPIKEPYAGPTDEEFEPFVLGYVELGGEVRVESWLVDVHPDEVRIGMEVELVIVPFRLANGSEVRTFAFRPVT